MRVAAWQHACKQSGGDRGLARLRPGMTTASFAAGRSFGIHDNHMHHNYIERPWGPGGASPG